MTGDSTAEPGRVQRVLLDAVYLARHGANVGHTCEGVENVSQVGGTTEARTQRTYHVNVTELDATRHIIVTDSLQQFSFY